LTIPVLIRRCGLLCWLLPILATSCNTQPDGGNGGTILPVFTGPGTSQSGGTSSVGNVEPGSVPSVSASLLEQLSLERINRARLRPAQEASNNGIAIDEGVPGLLTITPKPAVALNASLNISAREHSIDMLNSDYFAHNSLNGDDPFDRMADAGYVVYSAGENIAWRGTTGTVNEVQTVEAQHVDLFVDTGIANRGHRVTMLSRSFREVGIGIVRGQFTKDGTTYDSIMQTQDYGTAPTTQTFVLGVVYIDANGNSQYDYGEGTSGSSVKFGDVVKTTNSAGGYSFAVAQPGDYLLRFSNGQNTTLTIGTGTSNIKVDMIGGSLVINLGLGQLD
jgi:uncharacterized protein YkwD